MDHDLRLLREYEPIVKYTHGEQFFPCAVDPFVTQCSLWTRPPGQPPGLDIAKGELNLDALVAFSRNHAIPPGHSRYLRFVEEPLKPVAFEQWRRRRDRPRFRAPGRLAQVGLFNRLVDGMFDLSLVLRGTVPGGTTAAAEMQYRAIFEADPRYVYYGRVVRTGSYIILHYLFFYVMNDWRSTFHGINDHESDWEQVFVYLINVDGQDPQPAWVAYASHDFSGDDLRRRWDDPELEREGSHPVIYAGAGSHASYFLSGDYLTSVEIKALQPLRDFAVGLHRLWHNSLRQGERTTVTPQSSNLLKFPYVDYARGDGLAIGPGYDASWSPHLITDEMDWIESYRGLWGLDTDDPLGGERAPGGPRYNRDGTQRQSWYDPLGWAGLHKVIPTPTSITVLQRHITHLEHELVTVQTNIAEISDSLPQRELEARALQPFHHLQTLYEARHTHLAQQEQALGQQYARAAELSEILAACQAHLANLQAGHAIDPQAHITHKHYPQSQRDTRTSRLTSIWAAISSGLLLIGAAGLMLIRPDHWSALLVGFLVMFLAIEASLHQRLTQRLLDITIVLAIISGGILVIEFFPEVLFVTIAVLALTIIRDNLRELIGH